MDRHHPTPSLIRATTRSHESMNNLIAALAANVDLPPFSKPPVPIYDSSEPSSSELIGYDVTMNESSDLASPLALQFRVANAPPSAPFSFGDVVFCAPPSSFPVTTTTDAYHDTIKNIKTTMLDPSQKGTFLFTSSTSVYHKPPPAAAALEEIYTTFCGSQASDVRVFNELTPTSIGEGDNVSPRVRRMIEAELAALGTGVGAVVRLSGLYDMRRGAHNFWLSSGGKTPMRGSSEGLVNQLHYSDAARGVIGILRGRRRRMMKEKEKKEGVGKKDPLKNVYLLSDNEPLTRREICVAAIESIHYRKAKEAEEGGSSLTLPQFNDSNPDELQKFYDCRLTVNFLNDWASPRMPFAYYKGGGFSRFMDNGGTDHDEDEDEE
jgi:hypothetical protein